MIFDLVSKLLLDLHENIEIIGASDNYSEAYTSSYEGEGLNVLFSNEQSDILLQDNLSSS